MTSPVVVDLFAGGGGASEGIRRALGVAPRVAVNHDPAAIKMHAANHPGCMHLCEDVFRVTPFRPVRGRGIDLLWGSPACPEFSRARVGRPMDRKIRTLAWVLVDWARAVQPRMIALENVPEFEASGPLYPPDHPDPNLRNRPIPEQAGEEFRALVSALRLAGYRVEWRTLVAADYGAPTTRNRLYLIARCDGQPIVWPEPTHGPGRAHPWRTTAEIIDWTIPMCSIFATPDEAKAWARANHAGVPKRPLEAKTLQRIATGTKLYVLDRTPDVVRLADGPIAIWMAKHYGGVIGHHVNRPIGTITAKDHHSPVAVDLGEEPGPRAIESSAFLVSYYGTGHAHPIDRPIPTLTTRDRFGLVRVFFEGRSYVINDIRMRMLAPREQASAQGFGPEYILTGTQKEQTGRIGNSVCPPVAEAIVRANLGRSPATSLRMAA